ncbi:WG repeat-containing protein [Rouxiella chamberiensis]|uniref:WG repeat-containing protein n=1 Tax=Rouxiella chamberiensis TaxID=1513468 RepID=UPI0005D3E6AF|nr:WG repeat-containing protein [Rouxiella chamberiensis]
MSPSTLQTKRLSRAVRHALTLGGAMGLMAMTLPAHAVAESACFAPNTLDEAQRAERALPATQNICIRAANESRAAVLLPDAGQAIDDVALVKDLGGHRWGFLDNRGQLVIKPVFEQVGDFHYGLAAAKLKGKWGYIDATGKWAIQPTFDRAEDFTQVELALVENAGKTQLINRQGQTVGKPLDALVDDVQLGDGNPARLALSYKTVLLSPDDQRHVATDKMEVVQPFGKQGLFIARDADKGFGIADGDLAWRVEPQFSDITLSDNSSALAVAKVADGVVLIRDNGSRIDKTYQSVKALNGQFWLAKTADKNTLLDNGGNEIATLSNDAVAGLAVQGDYLLDNSGKETLALYVPGKKQPLSLPGGSTPLQADTGNFLLTTRGDQHRVNAIISPDGTLIGGTQPVNWLGQISHAQLINNRLWLHDSDGKIVNLVDNGGKLLLSAKNVALLADYQIQPLQRVQSDNTAPLALIKPDPQDPKAGAGFIRADGAVQLDSKWENIQPADSSESGQGGLARQFIVNTAQGTGIVDAQGKTLVPLSEDNIAPFVNGYALDYQDGKLTAIDTTGKHFALPNAFELQSLGNGWFRFRQTAAEGALWGIFDAVNQKVIAAPSYLSVGEFAYGLSNVQLPNARWGIIDGEGKPLVTPDFANVRRINNALWQLEKAPKTDDQPASATESQIIANDGSVRIDLTRDLNVNQFNDGRILATSGEGQSWLLNAQGNIELHEQQTRISAVGDWVKLSRQPQVGYLNAQGIWQIQPQIQPGSAFVNQRALRVLAQGSELIDEKGTRVAAMPEGDWVWPTGSAMAVSYDLDEGKATTRYVDSTGKLVLTVSGVGSLMQKGQAVLGKPDGSKTWIDAQGHPVASVNYGDLGLVTEGLAFARIGSGYGYVNAQGSFVIPPVFSAVSAFNSGVGIVSTPTMSMMLDATGKPLARVDHECGIQVLYDGGNTRQWPQKMPVKCD